MPLYEYRCAECETTLEAIQAFASPPLEECPECGRSSLKKLLSAPAFQFKGSGWYVSDYARKDRSAAGESGESGSGGAAATGDGSGSNGKSTPKESSSDSGRKTGASASSGKGESSAAAAS